MLIKNIPTDQDIDKHTKQLPVPDDQAVIVDLS